MKTILVDAVDCLIVKSSDSYIIFDEMHKLLELFPNKKIIVTNADNEQIKKFGLDQVPYEVFTLSHNPEKTESKYFETLLQSFGFNVNDIIYIEHNQQAVKAAESIGIKAYHFDSTAKDLKKLKDFLETNAN